MAVDLLTDNSGWVASPRISFSHDLAEADDGDGIPIERSRSDTFLSDPSPDFDFFIAGRLEPESTSADELFSDGKILPLQFKKSEACSTPNAGIESPKPEAPHQPSPPPPSPQLPPAPKEQKKESLREMLALSDAEEKSTTSSSKPFWRFNRSSSLNFASTHKISSIWSLPLLSRSKSTGSANPNSNGSVSKDTHKPLHKTPTNSNPSQRSPPPLQRPPPTKRNGSGGRTQYGYYGNSIKINPVLNVPPPYISKGTTTLFGFGYFFCSGKEGGKSRKKPFTPLNA
ncbi:hypothetical protein ACLOJK_001300 [Asimina triloba]